MRVVILVPRRADHGWRDELWNWLRPYLEETYGWPVIEGHHDEGLFCRSAAVNRAARDAGEWDVAVIADADIIAPGTQDAVEVAYAKGCMTLPHTEYCYLSEAGTRSVLQGAEPNREMVEWSGDGLGVAQCVVRRDL